MILMDFLMILATILDRFAVEVCKLLARCLVPFFEQARWRDRRSAARWILYYIILYYIILYYIILETRHG